MRRGSELCVHTSIAMNFNRKPYRGGAVVSCHDSFSSFLRNTYVPRDFLQTRVTASSRGRAPSVSIRHLAAEARTKSLVSHFKNEILNVLEEDITFNIDIHEHWSGKNVIVTVRISLIEINRQIFTVTRYDLTDSAILSVQKSFNYVE